MDSVGLVPVEDQVEGAAEALSLEGGPSRGSGLLAGALLASFRRRTGRAQAQHQARGYRFRASGPTG